MKPKVTCSKCDAILYQIDVIAGFFPGLLLAPSARADILEYRDSATHSLSRRHAKYAYPPLEKAAAILLEGVHTAIAKAIAEFTADSEEILTAPLKAKDADSFQCSMEKLRETLASENMDLDAAMEAERCINELRRIRGLTLRVTAEQAREVKAERVVDRHLKPVNQPLHLPVQSFFHRPSAQFA